MSVATALAPASQPAPAAPSSSSSSPALSPAAKYRGATLADLDLPPALSTTPATAVSVALSMCYDREYSQLTVVSAEKRALLGYVTVAALSAKPPTATVADAMNRFDRRKAKGYTVITPETALEDLERFFETEEFAVVTDAARRFVLGVATRGDLTEFLRRRPVV